MPHRARPWHDKSHPVHLTLRAERGLRSLRGEDVFPALRDAIRAASHGSFRIVHFSVQADHVHLLVEAKTREVLMKGSKGLAIRLARAANRVLGRTGRVWADRYHTRALRTPREVRNALVYVLHNVKEHGPALRAVDLRSSAPWFTGWRDRPAMPPAGIESPVVAPRTWLLQRGWSRHGLIAFGEVPRRPAPSG